MDPIGEDGAQAIEVAALLGDSVVSVKHCMDPKGGKISRATWTVLGLGAACLVASLVAFAMSVHVAAHNHAALAYWTHVAHKPAYAFRAQSLGAMYDFAAFGGLALGLSAMIVGLVRARGERRSPYYRIGTAPGVELPLETAPAASYPLIAPSATFNEFIFNYSRGIDGELIVDGKSVALEELAARGNARPSATLSGAIELPIPAHGKIRARTGQTTLLVSAVARPRKQAVPVLGALEGRTTAYFAGSLAAHLAVVAFLALVPVEDGAANVNFAEREDTSVLALTTGHEEKPPVVGAGDEGGGGETDSTAATQIASSSGGSPTPSPNVGKLRVAQHDAEERLTSAELVQRARSEGILGDTMMRDSIAAISTSEDFASGFDTTDQAGAVFGHDGETGTGFGYGRNGWGYGCDDDCSGGGHGTIHAGRLGPIGGRRGDGFNPFGEPGHGHRHVAGVPVVSVGQANPIGDYDKAIIRRYIKRNIDKIAFCYEKELLAKPALAGTIDVKFFIMPNGLVQGASGSGMDATVAECVAGVVGTIAFPASGNGGGVEVHYPFTFHPSGR